MRRTIDSTLCGVSKRLWNTATDCLKHLIPTRNDLPQFMFAVPQRRCRNKAKQLIGEAD